MIINKPLTSEINPNNWHTTRLHFDNGAVKNFYMRGSIAWPEGKKEGFALMAGLDLDERIVIVFEQFPFWTVPHWLNGDGTIHEREEGGYHVGLVQFISDNLSRYRCASYYWGGQHIDVFQRYGKEVYTNPQTTRRLELIEVPYVSEIGPNLLLEKINTEKFRVASETPLAQSIVQFVNMQAANIDCDNPALAMMTLLAGMNFQPWVNINAGI